MATYFGFSTAQLEAVRSTQVNTGVDGGAGSMTNPIKITKKFRLTDQELVVQDFLNSLNIPQGQKPGRPEYGTSLWSFVFEPNTFDVRVQIEAEIRRMASKDPRIILNSVQSYPQDNGILLELELAISPFNQVQNLAILFDQATGKAIPA
jgi:phage baseplate assembly protein W